MNVVDNEAESRYELEVDGAVAVAAYALERDRITFTHTVVPPALEGRGIATRLIEGALADVRARGLKAVPVCAFVVRYFEKHGEARDLLA